MNGEFGAKISARVKQKCQANLSHAEDLKTLLLPRVSAVDPAEVENFERVFDKRASEWRRWSRTVWEKKSADDSFLLRYAGDFADGDSRLLSWAVPTSMRNVDAECQAEITTLYLQEEENEGA